MVFYRAIPGTLDFKLDQVNMTQSQHFVISPKRTPKTDNDYGIHLPEFQSVKYPSMCV